MLLNQHTQHSRAAFDFPLTGIKYGQSGIVIFIIRNPYTQQINQRIIRLMFNEIFDPFQCILIIPLLAAARQYG